MTSGTEFLSRLVYPLAALSLAVSLAPAPARADFPGDVQRTFTTDIPHFFQDDIPCAFGGRPTSGTRTSCKSSGQAARPAAQHRAEPARKPTEPAASQADVATPPPRAGQ